MTKPGEYGYYETEAHAKVLKEWNAYGELIYELENEEEEQTNGK